MFINADFAQEFSQFQVHDERTHGEIIKKSWNKWKKWNIEMYKFRQFVVQTDLYDWAFQQ